MKIKFPTFEGSDRCAIMRAGKIRHTRLTDISRKIIRESGEAIGKSIADVSFTVVSTLSHAGMKTAAEVACALPNEDCGCRRIQALHTSVALTNASDHGVAGMMADQAEKYRAIIIFVLEKHHLENLFGVAELSNSDFPPGAMMWDDGSSGFSN